MNMLCNLGGIEENFGKLTQSIFVRRSDFARILEYSAKHCNADCHAYYNLAYTSPYYLKKVTEVECSARFDQYKASYKTKTYGKEMGRRNYP